MDVEELRCFRAAARKLLDEETFEKIKSTVDEMLAETEEREERQERSGVGA